MTDLNKIRAAQVRAAEQAAIADLPPELLASVAPAERPESMRCAGCDLINGCPEFCRCTPAIPAPEGAPALSDEQILAVIKQIDPAHEYIPAALKQLARAVIKADRAALAAQPASSGVSAAAPGLSSGVEGAQDLLHLLRAHIVWLAFGECRSPGWEGTPPSAREAVDAIDAALAAQPQPDQQSQFCPECEARGKAAQPRASSLDSAQPSNQVAMQASAEGDELPEPFAYYADYEYENSSEREYNGLPGMSCGRKGSPLYTADQLHAFAAKRFADGVSLGVEQMTADLDAAQAELALVKSAHQPKGTPAGYALIHEDALRAWGKLDEVRAACVYPVAAPSVPSPAVRAEPVAEPIRCPERLKNGGTCPHHNLHCGWPACNKETS